MNHGCVLVLGAGSSHSSGYPVGAGLRKAILQWQDDEIDGIANEMGVPRNLLRDFLREFRQAQAYSIDAFLARRATEFGDVGKAAIAKILLGCESSVQLFREDEKEDHWYQYLVNLLTASDWDALDLSLLSVVTFNYDRSLEFFLCRSLQSMYGKKEDEVVAKLSAARIVHVYGCLGTPWQSPDFLPYGYALSKNPDAVALAGARIRVIPEGRDEDECVLRAQALLREANVVCFLGFGYDQVNLRRLGVPGTLQDNHKNLKVFGGTSKGMTNAEMDRAIRTMSGGQATYSSFWTERFRDGNCMNFLRQTLMLG
jgi:hypothetical protein